MPLTPPAYAAIGAPVNWTRYIPLSALVGAAPAEPASATADMVTAAVAIANVALADRRGRRPDVISGPPPCTAPPPHRSGQRREHISMRRWVGGGWSRHAEK